jgi:hypothetical protein
MPGKVTPPMETSTQFAPFCALSGTTSPNAGRLGAGAAGGLAFGSSSQLEECAGKIDSRREV